MPPTTCAGPGPVGDIPGDAADAPAVIDRRHSQRLDPTVAPQAGSPGPSRPQGPAALPPAPPGAAHKQHARRFPCGHFRAQRLKPQALRRPRGVLNYIKNSDAALDSP